MKKITSFFLALVMVVCIFGAMPVLAADEVAQLYLSQESAIANDEFELTLSAKNFKDVAAAQIQINFGEIKFISLDSAFIKTGDYSLKNGLFKYVAFDTSLNGITSIFGETDEEVTVCKFTLKAPATAKKDDVLDIQFTDEFEFIDANNNDVEVSLTKGTLTVTADSIAQGKAPAPTLKSKTQSIVVLNSVAGCEYSKDGVNWQANSTFSGLSCNTAYKFYQRYSEKQGGYLVGSSSEALSVTTSNHSYTNNCDTTCNVCGAVRRITHAYRDYVTKATLKKNGSIVNKCSVCGSVYKKTTVYYPKTIKLSATSYTYNGKTKKPTVTVKGSNGKTISKSYYTVKYASGRKNVGKYKVTITFKGNYSGSKTLYFKINPPKTSVTKLTAAKKALTVSISKKTKQVTGYEIQYATNKKFSRAKKATIKSYKTTKTTLKKLSSKKTYYVRVRTYKTVGKTKYYSGWSTVKYKKTK